ncbi:IS1634 family transposase, partial [Microbacterium aurantiacum]|uniref:IS1634 family transposase n=1 Tax=Microbacterium aurantiacum TaxID=162393 RepID=UPI00403801E7
FDAHGGVLHDGETMESKRIMGVRENARQRRVVDHYSAKRDRRDNHTLDKQVERAQKIADGTKPLKKDRFVKLTGTRPAVDQVLVDRARQLAGLKGYVTNIPQVRFTGNEIVAAYHELFQVEASFRMAKTDLRARPMFHHEADSIHAHLTIVFTALAISRHLQDLTGASVRKIVRTLRPLRDVTISINGNEIVAKTPPGDTAQAILDAVAASVTH